MIVNARPPYDDFKGAIYEIGPESYTQLHLEDMPSLAVILAHAFQGKDPVADWIFKRPPTREQHERIFQKICSMTLRSGGTLFVNQERSACCLIESLYSGKPSSQKTHVISDVFREVVFENVESDRLASISSLLMRHRPKHLHHYISFFGVIPSCQGSGVGQRLMRSILFLKRDNPFYLETESKKNVNFWSKFDFVQTDKKVVSPNLAFYFMERLEV
jgi:ribosomal protein S18 acetylase RimI-like enzyme